MYTGANECKTQSLAHMATGGAVGIVTIYQDGDGRSQSLLLRPVGCPHFFMGVGESSEAEAQAKKEGTSGLGNPEPA
jgi:hypothetical protein